LKAANGLGMSDMGGNVSEWVNDWHLDIYYWSSPAVDPPGPLWGQGKGVRGGQFNSDSYSARASYRLAWPALGRDFRIGFRVARNP
jgi:formylglycine-generating enzyme required for sulfatase activity